MRDLVRARVLFMVAFSSAFALASARASGEQPFEPASPSGSAAAPAPRSAAPTALTAEAATASSATEAVADALFEQATPGGLTADEVARQARATSYVAAAQNEALVAAQARVNEALVAYFPKLTAIGSYTRLSPITAPVFQGLTFPTLRNATLCQASLIVPLSDYLLRISQSYAAASHSEKAAALDEAAARLNSGLEGKMAYYTWLRARAQRTVAERNLKVTQAHVADARNAFEIGTASRANLLSAEAQVASAELVLQQERDAVYAAEDQVRIAMHDRTGRVLPIGEDLRGAAQVFEVQPRDVEALRAEALEKRLELRALDETIWSLRDQLQAAKASLYPRLDGVADVVVANPNPRYFPQQDVFHTTWDVGIRLTWSPNDTLTALGTTSEARAHARQTEQQKAALMDAVRTEVLSVYQALAEASVAVQTTARALAAAEEAYRARREQFRNGRATSVALQDAEIALFQAGFESVNAHANARIARAKLLHAVGRDVGEVGHSGGGAAAAAAAAAAAR